MNILRLTDHVVLVQLLSCDRTFVTPCTAACQAPLSFTISLSLLRFMSIELVMMLPKNLILCRPFLLLPSILLSNRAFSSESVLCIRWPKFQSFSISLSNKYSGLISLRVDWFDLLSKELSRVFSNTTVQKQSIRLLYGPTLTSIYDYWKNHSFDYRDLCW